MSLTVAQLVARLTADTSGFYRSMAVANASMIRSGSIISRVAAGSSLAVVGIGLASIRSAANFEQSMNILGAVSGATSGQMKDLNKTAIDLGNDLKLPNVSAKDAAEAMTELSKGGLSVNDIMKATRGTLQLGIAANIGFSDSALLIARSLKAFNLEGSQATKFADMFTNAANKSTASAVDIALGFQQASAVWNQAGMSALDLTTAVTEMADAGIVGSDAGTSLKTMMQRLIAPTAKSAGKMKELGISIYDAQGHVKPMPAIIKNFENALGGLSDKQRNAAMQTMFGSDAIRAANIVLRGGSDKWKEYTKAVDENGTAQKYAEAVTAGLNGKIGGLGSVLQTLAITFGTALLPAAKAVVAALTQFAVYLQNNADAIMNFIASVKDAVVAFGTWVGNTNAAQYAIAALVGVLAGLVIIQQVVAMVNALKAAWLVLNASFVASPIGLIVLAIAALAGALVLAYIKVEWFRDAVNAAFAAIVEWVVPKLQELWTNVQNIWSQISSTIQTVGTAIIGFVRTHWDTIKAIFSPALEFLLATVKNIFNLIKTNIEGTLKIIQGIIKTVTSLIKGDWSGAWDGIKMIVDGVWTIIKGIVTTGINSVKTTMSAVWGTIKALTGVAWQGIKTAISGAWDGITTAVTSGMTNVKTAVTNGFNAVTRFIEGIPGTVYNLALDIGIAIVKGIKAGIESLWEGVKGWFEKKLSDLLHPDIPFMSPPEHAAAEAIGVPIAKGIMGGILMQMPATKAALEGAIGEALTSVGAQSEKAKSEAEKLGEAVKAGVTKKMEELKTEMGRLAGLVIQELESRLSEARAAAERAFSGLGSAASQALDAVLAKQKTPAEQQLAAMEKAEKEKALLKAESDAGILLANAKTNEEMLAAEEAYAAAEQAILKYNLEQQAATERAQMDINNGIKREKFTEAYNNLVAHLAETGASYGESQREIIKLLNSFGIDYNTAGSLLTDKFAFGLRSKIKEAAASAQKVANQVKELEAYKDEFKKSGLLLGDSFAEGLKKSIPNVAAAARLVAQAAANNLKLKSPAKEGPLSTLNTWWKPFADTLLGGFSIGPAVKAKVSKEFSELPDWIQDQVKAANEATKVLHAGSHSRWNWGQKSITNPPGMGYQASTSNGVTTIIYQNVEGSLIKETELNDRIRDAIIVESKRGRSI